MRRRLAIAILLTVWSVLVAGGTALYLGVRSIVINDLDALLYARASALPELAQPAESDPAQVPNYDWHDRYVIRTAEGLASEARAGGAVAPRLTAARFTTDPEGHRWRTVTVAGLSADASKPVTVEYSGRTERVDGLLHRLGVALIIFGLACGAAAAAVASWVAKAVLRPLESTARWIGTIDEKRLNERVSLERLPSELLPVSDRLNEMLSRLERAFVTQKQFVASASQELRSPVAALASTLEKADQQPHSSDTQRDAIRQCIHEVHVLRVLLDRLTEFIGETPNDGRLEPTDVVALVKESISAAGTLARAREITIKQSGPQSLHCVLPSNRLRSILANLLSNAVEHNPNGSQVEVTFLHDGQQLHVRVSDNGPGIDAEHLPHLFEAFYQVNRDRGPAPVRQLGLGLYIVQSHLTAMNGSARVESRPGHGTAVDIEFPCEARLPEGLLHVPSPSTT
jgi:two-component system heavy metal sensor histidine kinase CusS